MNRKVLLRLERLDEMVLPSASIENPPSLPTIPVVTTPPQPAPPLTAEQFNAMLAQYLTLVAAAESLEAQLSLDIFQIGQLAGQIETQTTALNNLTLAGLAGGAAHVALFQQYTQTLADYRQAFMSYNANVQLYNQMVETANRLYLILYSNQPNDGRLASPPQWWAPKGEMYSNPLWLPGEVLV